MSERAAISLHRSTRYKPPTARRTSSFTSTLATSTQPQPATTTSSTTLTSVLLLVLAGMFSVLSSLFGSSVPIDAADYRASPSDASAVETAYFASGCFWGTEHIFQKHYGPQSKTNPDKKGILSTAVGYTGGNPKITKPTYEQVCSGRTDHAEAIKVEFDPRVVSYAELVEFFYRTHDPTTKNRQGNDSGSQYRSAIFTTTPEQAEIANRVAEEVQAKHFSSRGKKIVTEIKPFDTWWNAEDYHQLYLFKNPSGYQCPTHRLHW